MGENRPPRSPKGRVDTLPADVRMELSRKLIDNGFSDYRGLSDWLAERGFAVGRMALNRYGRRLEARIYAVRQATEMAEALVRESGDDTGALADASLRMVQHRAFEALLDAERGDLGELAKTGRSLADVSRASMALRSERRKILAEAARAAEKAARESAAEAGVALPRKVLHAIRSQVYGLGDA